MDYIYLIFGGVALGSIVCAFYFAWTQYERKHVDHLQTFALEHGFSFIPMDDGQYIRQLSNFQVFNEGRAHKVSNILVGSVPNGTLIIFEHSYIVMRAIVKQTAAIIHSQKLELPRFELRYDWSFPGGHDGIKFSSHPEFSSRYLLHGDDESSLRRLFDADLLSFLEKHVGLGVEGCKNDLLIYRENKLLEAHEISAFTALCQNLHSLFYR